MEIGKIIKKYRDEHQLTMQQLADRAALSKGYISMLEKGKHPQNGRPIIPSIETVQKLAAAMNVSVDCLLEQCGSDQLIEVPASSSAPDQAAVLDPAEEHLLSVYRDLNNDGRNKLLGYADDLQASGRYKKYDSVSDSVV